MDITLFNLMFGLAKRQSESSLTATSSTTLNNSSIFSLSTTSNNNSLSLNDQNYSSMSLAELKNKKALLISQLPVAAENYPELVAQYQVMINKINTEIDNKTAQTQPNNILNILMLLLTNQNKLQNVSVGSAQTFQQDFSKMSLTELKAKRAQLVSQSQAAAENYPELKAQYQTVINKIDVEMAKKSDAIFTSMGQSSPNIMNSLMALLFKTALTQY